MPGKPSWQLPACPRAPAPSFQSPYSFLQSALGSPFALPDKIIDNCNAPCAGTAALKLARIGVAQMPSSRKEGALPAAESRDEVPGIFCLSGSFSPSISGLIGCQILNGLCTILRRKVPHHSVILKLGFIGTEENTRFCCSFLPEGRCICSSFKC